MRKWTVSIAVVAALSFTAPFIARAGSRSSAWDKLSVLLTGKRADDNFKLMHVADLAALRADPNSHVVILDANVDTTRDKYGVIPGARLLTTYDNYDVATMLIDGVFGCQSRLSLSSTSEPPYQVRFCRDRRLKRG
jgi:hypothetical protein